ncbi:1-aminocyclopropane-1-carboxylate deaminase/D-cysteine desulfhydrase [Sphingobacterium sp. MYb382]|uniref:1-aminocyclopropane-1-carboxylate deaminase/D-cysteine desulfhydrase n=1 Tax=Sphingobacterium sp. MYb382 TaxID=2745278 RepID=UPI00309506D4
MLAFSFYSPEEEIKSSLFREKKVRVFVKRDDLIHPYISGNKWRKLKYPLKEARKQGKNKLVTFGGAWSNHLLATAAAAAKFGFQSYAFVRGEEISNPVLTLCKVFGMHLHFVSRSDYQEKTVLFERYFTDDQEAFFINEGGYGTMAAQGVAELVSEFQEDYTDIICACGTGATVAGLIQGQAAGSQTRIHGIPVLKGGDFIREEVAALGQDSTSLLLHNDYHFGGYAKTKPELIQFVKDFSQETGILIEPTYTGKAFYGLYDLIKQNYFPPEAKIVIIHTGGLTGFLGMIDKF